MIQLLKKKPVKRKRPLKTEGKSVTAKQYNGLIDYYTAEIDSLKKEIDCLREQNRMIMNTAVKQGERARQLEERNKQLSHEKQVLVEKGRKQYK
ncbi:MAG: hypothetical protein ACE5DM_03310 [Candidatus Nanoarchaeia archaeon]